MRRRGAIALLLVLCACQSGGTNPPLSDVAAPTALQGPAVATTTLAPMGEVPPPSATAETPPQTPGVAPPVAETKPSAPVVTPPVVEAKPLEPVIIKTAVQLACEKKHGRFVMLGKTGAMTCQFMTKDSGKRCSKETDCEGACLARSRTCAPVKPILGCESILQGDGRQVELCIE
ncbi:hypothetical protein [Pseudorhodobacter sp.]|uniref:hypothetical protein n=1 Tax=Pseudorhodobacter sp. TaxID=1934400 RepID=UPI0026482650|nr:hypothetical protein [Pseudorhodobacter sp.]MDN5788220.1 hypothetical protein [Pseudorhodobacter sp.]